MITSSPVAEPANSTSVGEKLLAVGQQMGNTTCKAPPQSTGAGPSGRLRAAGLRVEVGDLLVFEFGTS